MNEDFSPFFAGLDVIKAVFVTAKFNREVTGYFDNSYIDANLGETILDTGTPRLTCKTEDIKFLKNPSEFRGMKVFIRDTEYSIIKVQHEGTGLSTVALAHEDNE